MGLGFEKLSTRGNRQAIRYRAQSAEIIATGEKISAWWNYENFDLHVYAEDGSDIDSGDLIKLQVDKRFLIVVEEPRKAPGIVVVPVAEVSTFATHRRPMQGNVDNFGRPQTGFQSLGDIPICFPSRMNQGVMLVPAQADVRQGDQLQLQLDDTLNTVLGTSRSSCQLIMLSVAKQAYP